MSTSDFRLSVFLFIRISSTIEIFFLFWIMNVYSDSSHSVLKYLKDSEANISNLLIMTGNFNIRDSIWDPSFPRHSFISDNLIIIADSSN